MDFKRKILDIMIKPIMYNHTVKWKNMLRQSIKKHLMTEFLSGITNSKMDEQVGLVETSIVTLLFSEFS